MARWTIYPTFVLPGGLGEKVCVIEGPIVKPGQSVEVVPRAAAESLAQALEQFVETGSPTAMFYALAAYRAAHPKAEP